MSRFLSFALLTLFSLSTGCGSKYPLNEVTGKVTLDGAPLTNAVVVFNPVSGSNSASGVTDQSGAYRIRDIRADADFGAEAGDYDVTVIWGPPPAVDTSNMDSSSPEYEKMAANLDKPSSTKAPVNKFPTAYGNPKSSTLKATVTKGKNENVNFDLSSKGPGK